VKRRLPARRGSLLAGGHASKAVQRHGLDRRPCRAAVVEGEARCRREDFRYRWERVELAG
jgi:hypothetical protein